MKKYALFDWDNTLRKGFTITAWMKYLYDESIIEEKYYSDLLNQFELYKINRISYKQLSYNTTSIYANAISGVQFSCLENLGRGFCREDNFIFPYTYQLFDFFHRNKIEIIIISGSPQMLLMEYAKLLGINEMYGMVVEVKNDYFTTNVSQDYGINKTNIVHVICESKGCMPIFALGDSLVDEPMLSVAKYKGIVDKESGNILFDNKTIGTIFSIKEYIEKFLSVQL